MKNLRTLFLLLITLFILGCSQKEINYHSNPNIIEMPNANEDLVLGNYKFLETDGKLTIYNNDKSIELGLPENQSKIQSLHLSYDQKFLAFDATVEKGLKIFVVDLLTGDVINLSEQIGYLYDYDGYEKTYGIAWAPKQNIIAFIGGNSNSAKVDLYHLEMENSKQAHGGSFVFNDVYGVKWDSKGESLYYLVDSLDNENMYQVYQTEIEYEEYLLGGTVNVIAEIPQENYEKWFSK